MTDGVRALRPFVPAKDFDTSRRFYEALGFRAESLDDRVVEFHMGPYSFLLQDHYVEDWAGNFMMHVLVADLDAWWQRIAALDLPTRFGVPPPRPPKAESWGLTVAYVFDPSGVLWHFAQILNLEQMQAGPNGQKRPANGPSKSEPEPWSSHTGAGPSSRVMARLSIVQDHLDRENDHDLDGIMKTFGATARYDDEPWDAHYTGHDGVHAFYDDLLRAMPDLQIAVRRRHAAEEDVILEAVIRGTHRGAWRGLPATGRRVEFPLCAIFTFDDDDRLIGERIYYDRATVLRQLGVFHEPERVAGRLTIALTHPLTMASIIGRKIMRRHSDQRPEMKKPPRKRP